MLRLILIGLLLLWSGLGIVATLAALTGPSVWWNEDDVRSRGVVGMPLRGAAETTAIRFLLADVPVNSAERWLIRFPPGSDELVLTYVRYQLAHLEYPRRLDVVGGEPSRRMADYAGVIAAPGINLPGGWHPAAEYGGFISYRAGGT